MTNWFSARLFSEDFDADHSGELHEFVSAQITTRPTSSWISISITASSEFLPTHNQRDDSGLKVTVNKDGTARGSRREYLSQWRELQ